MSTGTKRRKTYQRQVILNILKSTNTHPTADWVYERAREYIPNISLGTVYRNLKILKEVGELLEINDGKQSRFDARVDKHHHFKCISCGGIYDIEPDEVKIKENLKEKGFIPFETEIFITGICKKCNKKR